jgi:hypothetical protein
MIQEQNDHLKGAIVNALINGIINGAIYWFQTKGSASVLLTDNLISSDKHTVFSGAVVLATSLAFILSSIAYFTVKKAGKPPYFPKIFLLAVKNAVFAFGIVTIMGILIQRYLGSLEVSTPVATLITGLIAGAVGGTVDYLTKKAI